jgi:hypothetical protein
MMMNDLEWQIGVVAGCRAACVRGGCRGEINGKVVLVILFARIIENGDSTSTLHNFNTKNEFWKKFKDGDICVQFIPAG